MSTMVTSSPCNIWLVVLLKQYTPDLSAFNQISQFCICEFSVVHVPQQGHAAVVLLGAMHDNREVTNQCCRYGLVLLHHRTQMSATGQMHTWGNT